MCWCLGTHSLGTVINANNSNNNTLYTSNNNNKQLCAFDITLFVPCTPCFAPSFVYSARSSWFLASPALPNTVLCLLLLVLLPLLLLAVVPVDLFFLNTILISAMLPILYHESSAHTHFFFPSFAFLSFALPHSHRSSLFSTSLICLLQRAPRTPSYRQQAREPIDRVVVHDSSRLNPVSTYPSRILTTNHGTHCIHTRILFCVDRTASSSALLDTCTPDTLRC